MMLHFGYFDDVNIDPDTISVRDIEAAQVRYSDWLFNIGFNIGFIIDFLQILVLIWFNLVLLFGS